MTSPARNLTFRESITTTSVRETSTTSHFASASSKSKSQSPSPQSSPCSPPPHTGAGSQSGHSTRPDSGHLNPSWLVMSALQVRRTKTFSSVVTDIALSPSRTTRTAQGPPTGNNPVMLLSFPATALLAGSHQLAVLDLVLHVRHDSILADVPHGRLVPLLFSVPPAADEEAIFPGLDGAATANRGGNSRFPRCRCRGAVPSSRRPGAVPCRCCRGAVPRSRCRGEVPSSLRPGAVPSCCRIGVVPQCRRPGEVPRRSRRGAVARRYGPGAVPGRCRRGAIPRRPSPGAVPRCRRRGEG